MALAVRQQIGCCLGAVYLQCVPCGPCQLPLLWFTALALLPASYSQSDAPALPREAQPGSEYLLEVCLFHLLSAWESDSPMTATSSASSS